ncbi:MAG: BatD family protein [Planctomycetota bacterium]|nr:BatD family protein [Planctomycetota bacterium]
MHLRTPNLLRVCALLLGAVASLAAAEDRVRVEAELETTQLYIGESVVYQVTVHNLEQAPAPDLSALSKDFKVDTLGDRSLNSTSISSINGRWSENRVFGHVFQYRLTPLRAGKLEVPEPVVTVKGTAVRGQALALEVLPPDKQDVVRLEIAVEPKHIYAGAPFKVVARILLKPLPQSDRNPVSLLRPSSWSIPWVRQPPDELKAEFDLNKLLSPLLVRDGRGFCISNLRLSNNDPFSFFEHRQEAVFRPEARREIRKDAGGADVNYWVYEIPFEFTAPRPGPFAFGPMTLRGSFVTGRDQRSFLTREIYAVAPAVDVNVIDLLARPAPADFTGAIGRVDLSAQAQPESLRVGDPLTLTLEIRNGGKADLLKLIGPPDLSAAEGLERDFAIIDARPVGEVVDGAKLFKYALRPKRAGVHLPAITLSWFDVEKESFERVSTKPIELTVTESAKVGGADVYASAPDRKESSALKEVEGGIFRNMTEPRDLGDRRDLSAYYFASPAVLLVGYVALSLFVGRRRRLAADPALQRRARALREARRRIGANEGPATLRAALLGFVADLRNLPEAGLMPREAAEALKAGGAGDEARAQFLSLLEGLESAAYGGASGGDLAALRARAVELAERLEREVKA